MSSQRYFHDYHERNKERINAARRALYAADPSQRAEHARVIHWRLKLAAIQALGGRCIGCGETNPLVLSINHINGTGVPHGKRHGPLHALTIFRAIRDGKMDMTSIDLRCMNCQVLYEYERGVLRLPESEEHDELWASLAPALQGVAGCPACGSTRQQNAMSWLNDRFVISHQ
jgi:hypothetical protein